MTAASQFSAELKIDVGTGAPVARDQETVKQQVSELNTSMSKKTANLKESERNWQHVDEKTVFAQLEYAINKAKRENPSEAAEIARLGAALAGPLSAALKTLAEKSQELATTSPRSTSRETSLHKDARDALDKLPTLTADQKKLLKLCPNLARVLSDVADTAGRLGRQIDIYAKVRVNNIEAGKVLLGKLRDAESAITRDPSTFGTTSGVGVDREALGFLAMKVLDGDLSKPPGTPGIPATTLDEIKKEVKTFLDQKVSDGKLGGVSPDQVKEQVATIAQKLFEVLDTVAGEQRKAFGSGSDMFPLLERANTLVGELEPLSNRLPESIDTILDGLPYGDNAQRAEIEKLRPTLKEIEKHVDAPDTPIGVRRIIHRELPKFGKGLKEQLDWASSERPQAEAKIEQLISGLAGRNDDQILAHGDAERARMRRSLSRKESIDFPTLQKRKIVEGELVVAETYTNSENKLCVRLSAKTGDRGELSIVLGDRDPEEVTDTGEDYEALRERIESILLTDDIDTLFRTDVKKDGREIDGKSEVFKKLRQMSIELNGGVPQFDTVMHLSFDGESNALQDVKFTSEIEDVSITNCNISGVELQKVSFAGLVIKNNSPASELRMVGCSCRDREKGTHRSSFSGNTGVNIKIEGLEGQNMLFRENVIQGKDSRIHFTSHDQLDGRTPKTGLVARAWTRMFGDGIADGVFSKGAFYDTVVPKDAMDGAFKQLEKWLDFELKPHHFERLRALPNKDTKKLIVEEDTDALKVEAGPNKYTSPGFKEHACHTDKDGNVQPIGIYWATNNDDELIGRIVPVAMETDASGNIIGQRRLRADEFDGIGGDHGMFPGLKREIIGGEVEYHINGNLFRDKDHIEEQMLLDGVVRLVKAQREGRLAGYAQAQQREDAKAKAAAAAAAGGGTGGGTGGP